MNNQESADLFFPSARHQGRRGAGHADQGHHRRRRRHPSHPQVSHREEGRGNSAHAQQVLDSRHFLNSAFIAINNNGCFL